MTAAHSQHSHPQSLKDDIFGGLAAMLVAFPSAVAFGLLVFGGLGPEMKGPGALAGMIGAMMVGIIAPLFGGAPRLVSSPCAPAAAVLGAFVMQQAKIFPESVFLLVTITSLLCGLIQIAFGSLGGGKVIKYIPFPVVAGYLSGVGCLIFLGQAPKFLGLPKEISFAKGLLDPSVWSQPAIITGLAAILAMVFAARITRALPAPIIALVASGLTYFALTRVFPGLDTLENNPLVIGAMPAASLGSVFTSMFERFASAQALSSAAIMATLVPAATLAVLLSIDTLKTCVIVDALTHTRHESNRELIAQGLGNVSSSILGGLPGAGTMGATLVNISSGGHSRLSGIFQGVFSGLAFLLLAPLVAWIPVAALAGILIVVAVRMIDRKSFNLLKQRTTMLDFGVIMAVVITALAANLIAAAGVGLAFAIVLFIRDQIRASVVRRFATLAQISSKRKRVPAEIEVLKTHGAEAILFELQGALFFGTTDQLSTIIDPHLGKASIVILDMKRVQSVDFTATHLIELIESRVRQKGGKLALSQIPESLPTGQNLREYFAHVGLTHHGHNIEVFPALDDTLEWAEEQLLDRYLDARLRRDRLLEMSDIPLFQGLPSDTMMALRACLKNRELKVGDKAFSAGDGSDELYIIRKGEVRIMFPIAGREPFYVASFGAGDFFGDMSFLDHNRRSADAIAREDCAIWVLSRTDLEKLIQSMPSVGAMVFERMARVLAIRLRHADAELRALADA